MTMDIKQYAAFVESVKTGSLSSAGKELGYTPSGIIRLINTLEKNLGFALLLRTSTGVKATAEGKRMYPLLMKIVDLHKEAQQTGERIRGLAEGTLSIGVLDSIAHSWLPPVLDTYQESFPAIKINILEGSNTHLSSLLEQHKIDICISQEKNTHCHWISLGKQELIACLPSSSPLLKHESLLLAELDGMPYIRIHPEDTTVYEKLFSQKGIEPDVRFTTSSYQEAYSLVGAGLGMALCCTGSVIAQHNNVGLRPLSPRRFIEFGLSYTGNVSKNKTKTNTRTNSGNNGSKKSNAAPAVEKFIEIATQFKMV